MRLLRQKLRFWQPTKMRKKGGKKLTLPRDALKTKGIYITIPIELYELIKADMEKQGALSPQDVVRPILAAKYYHKNRGEKA